MGTVFSDLFSNRKLFFQSEENFNVDLAEILVKTLEASIMTTADVINIF